MGSYFRSRDFPIHMMVAWWVFWLTGSYSSLNEFNPPSPAATAQFAILIGAFCAGHLLIKHRWALGFRSTSKRIARFRAGSTRMQLLLRASALSCTIMLLVALQLSGAFSSTFIEYFAKLRLGDEGVEALTGIRSLDVLTKILAFPMSYTIIVVALASNGRQFRWTLAICVANLLAFAYLWQVNYPLIHLFWFLVFHSLLQAHRRGAFETKTVLVVLLLVTTLLASAVNRFGGDVIGGLQRYIVGYHLVGFSFYDSQYQDPNSILHSHSYGRSSLGFLDQMLEALSRLVGAGYQAASSENSNFNNDPVDIGLFEVREFNAFGTVLFSLFRDFHIVGIAIGGFLYGAFASHALRRSPYSWTSGALFIILASSWMVGMMVNPLEQAYFWFSIVTLAAFSLVNRRVYTRPKGTMTPSR